MNNYEDYDDFHHEQVLPSPADEPLLTEAPPLQTDVDFDDPIVAALPRVLLMGPRRGGKTSIQVCVVCVFFGCVTNFGTISFRVLILFCRRLILY
jgi:hypothetical protein